MNQQPEDRYVSRRGFLRHVAALSTAAGATGLLAACQPAPLTPAPDGSATQAAEPDDLPAGSPETAPAAEDADSAERAMAQVAFVKTDDRVSGVRRALELLGGLDVTNRGVLLKPNFNSADPAPGSTHPDVLLTVLEALQQGQAQSITIADRSGMGNTRQVMEQLGVFEMAAAFDAETIALEEVDQDGWAQIELPDSHWSQGFPFARCCLDADAVVQLCCLKTHRYGGHFTMSLKNSVGLVAKYGPGDGYNYMNELHTSDNQRPMIAEVNAAYDPALIVLDGVEAFVRGGPASGERVQANVVLAGSDRIAMDAVGVALLRYYGTTAEVSQGAIFQQAQIARAVELGLGVNGPHRIDLVTDDAESAAYAEEIRQILALG